VKVKVVKYIYRWVRDAVTGKWLLKKEIVGKKASIIKLCRKGKLNPRKCRKYKVVERW